MSKLNIDQKTIKLLLTDKHSDFLIPDYQRPYAWGEDECATLWDDLFTFAFPNDDCDAFESTSDEYFLGPIVTFKNGAGQLEIIDGQQRLTTIMLLLRAFYDKFANMKDKQSIKVRDSIAGCVWKTDEFDDPDMDALKIDSEVASDSDKDEFLDILRHGSVGPTAHSAYSRNYAFFSKKNGRNGKRMAKLHRAIRRSHSQQRDLASHRGGVPGHRTQDLLDFERPRTPVGRR